MSLWDACIDLMRFRTLAIKNDFIDQTDRKDLIIAKTLPEMPWLEILCVNFQ